MDAVRRNWYLGGGGINAYIKSLNPVFWIDLLDIVDGHFVDKSGNNHLIEAVSVAYADRCDFLKMPANDTTIINTLKGTNMYNYFYTDDSTPLTVQAGGIFPKYSNYLIVGKRYMYLFNNLTAVQVSGVLTREQFIDYDFFNADINLIDRANYYTLTRTNVIPSTTSPGLVSASLNTNCVYDDNTHVFSKTKKSIKLPITNSPATDLILNVYTYIFRGSASFGFWFKITGLTDDTVVFRIMLRNYLNIGVDFRIRKSLMYKGYTSSSAYGSGIVDEVVGDYAHITVKTLALPYNLSGTINATIIYYAAPVGANYDIEITDLVLVNNNSGINLATTYKGVERRSTKFFGKKITFFGDSITVGGWGDLIPYLLGIGTNINVSTGGIRMGNIGSSWMGTYINQVLTLDTDIIVINAGANDGGSVIGTIDDTETNTYYGGYKYCIEYIQANSSAKILLITPPFIASGNTVALGRAQYEQQYINLSNAVKELAEYYNIDVCDLHALTSLNWDNVQIYLSDKVHWTYLMTADACNIVAKHMLNSAYYD